MRLYKSVMEQKWIQFCLYCTGETKLSRYWQGWNWVRIYGGLDIFIWIYFYIFLDWTHYQEEGWGAAWLDRRRGKYKGIEKGWWHGKEMTKKWNDYFYKLMKMLCERRIPRPLCLNPRSGLTSGCTFLVLSPIISALSGLSPQRKSIHNP